MSSLLSKLRKNSRIDDTSMLGDSKILNSKDFFPINVPILNIATAGDLDGGMKAGSTVLAGPSRHFKSLLGLICAKSYLDHYEDAAVLMYDSEFGTPPAYFHTVGVPLDRVIHCPVQDIEQLKLDLVHQLENLDKGDHLMVLIDSIGNLASKKELEDALDNKSVADMSRAKALKGLFRMITPFLTIKNVPMVSINHTYKEIGMFPKDVVSGGQGPMLGSDTVWIIGRQQEKAGTEVVGYNFIINVEKSRYVKEKSKIPFSVSFDGGMDRYSGLLDIALTSGHVVKPSQGWYQLAGDTGKKYRKAELENNDDFWKPILNSEDFREFVRAKYQVGRGTMLVHDHEEEVA